MACVADKKEHNARGTFKYDFLWNCTPLGVNPYCGAPPPASYILFLMRPFAKIACSVGKSRERASRADKLGDLGENRIGTLRIY